MRQTPWAAGAQLGLTGTVWASSTTVTLTILVLVDAFDHYLSTESALVPPTSSGESLAPEPRAAGGPASTQAVSEARVTAADSRPDRGVRGRLGGKRIIARYFFLSSSMSWSVALAVAS